MKIWYFAILLLLLTPYVSTVSCYIGYYDQGGGVAQCMQCPPQFSACTSSTSGTFHSRISGYIGVGALSTVYCPDYTVGGTIPTVYNKEANLCQYVCKTGCLTCVIDYDFCTSCQSGYVWSNDYTCIPAVLGIEATCLALLLISLVFSIVGFCFVSRARKSLD